MTMNHLFTYVRAINDDANPLIESRVVIEQEQLEEDGILTDYGEYRYVFNNGVVIKQTLETEQGDDANEVTCPECWISYEVLSQPQGIEVSPKQKHFINRCQQSFWLKISQAQ